MAIPVGQNRRSMTLWDAAGADALGTQIIQCPAARAFDGDANEFAFGQFFAAVAAAYFFHWLQISYKSGSLAPAYR